MGNSVAGRWRLVLMWLLLGGALAGLVVNRVMRSLRVAGDRHSGGIAASPRTGSHPTPAQAEPELLDGELRLVELEPDEVARVIEPESVVEPESVAEVRFVTEVESVIEAQQPDVIAVDASADAGAASPGPYPGSVLPLPDGSAPSADYLIKGNVGSKRSHGPGSPYYARTRAEVWFRTEKDAAAAGFRPWTPRK